MSARWYLVNESSPDGRRLYSGERGGWEERRGHVEPFRFSAAAWKAKREWEREGVDSYVVRVGPKPTSKPKRRARR